MRTMFLSTGITGVMLVVLAPMASPAVAESMPFKAELKAASEVPPNSSKGIGSGVMTYDTATKMLTWTVTFSNLTGNVTGAHFHGPAETDKNAAVAVAIPGTASPIKGTATLTDAQAADLVAGKWYINVHTAANKDGEIRGQVMKGK